MASVFAIIMAVGEPTPTGGVLSGFSSLQSASPTSSPPPRLLSRSPSRSSPPPRSPSRSPSRSSPPPRSPSRYPSRSTHAVPVAASPSRSSLFVHRGWRPLRRPTFAEVAARSPAPMAGQQPPRGEPPPPGFPVARAFGGGGGGTRHGAARSATVRPLQRLDSGCVKAAACPCRLWAGWRIPGRGSSGSLPSPVGAATGPRWHSAAAWHGWRCT
jgi:hypothetical protein